MIYNKGEYKQIIADSLLEQGIINNTIYEKCSKPHVTGLPHDLRTNDSEKLQKRKNKIIQEWNKTHDEIMNKNYPDEFFELSQTDTYDDEGWMHNYDGDKLVEHYNNLLNTSISLNDAIRERYDNQIDKLNKDIENYKEQVKIRDDEINHYLKEQENLEKDINKNTKELRKETENLDHLEFELDNQNALLENVNDHYEVMERMRQALGLPEDFTDAFNIDYAPQRELNNLSPGFGDYVAETLDLAYLYEEEGRPIETIQRDINKSRDTIHSLNVSIDSDNSRISSLNDTMRNHKEQRDWNMRQYHASQDRISFLKKNKPNKDKSSDDSYINLVDLKNQAIQFKNDINKAHDYQRELGRVNDKLGFDVDNIWDGLPSYGDNPWSFF